MPVSYVALILSGNKFTALFKKEILHNGRYFARIKAQFPIQVYLPVPILNISIDTSIIQVYLKYI